MGLKLLCVTKCENLQFRNLNVSLSCNSHFSNKVRMNVLYGQPMRKQRFIIRMAPEDEKMTKRSPLDFPQVIIVFAMHNIVYKLLFKKVHPSIELRKQHSL